jgi:hypothetical protein
MKCVCSCHSLNWCCGHKYCTEILFCYSILKICGHKLYIWLALCLHELMLIYMAIRNRLLCKSFMNWCYMSAQILHSCKSFVTNSTLECLISLMNWWYVFIHLNGFFSSWTEATCLFMLRLRDQLNSQMSHSNRFFPSLTDTKCCR